MTSVGDSFAWPFQDPGWAGKIVVQGLIFIIPIVGWIALYGWLMLALDNYRAGRRELPPAGFHLERGLAPFVVYFVYAIVLGIPGGFLQVEGANANSSGLVALGNLVNAALSLALAFVVPALILSTYRGGFAAGFDVAAVWALATRSTSTTVVAALLTIVAGLIAAVGFAVCCVGAIFTIPYAAAIVAGVVAWYEGQLTGPAQLPAQPAR